MYEYQGQLKKLAEAPLPVFLELPRIIKRYTCAATTAISKGVLVQLSDPHTVIKGEDPGLATVAGTNGIFVGSVWADKNASDGSTEVSVAIDPIMDVRASGAIIKGQRVVLAGNNEVRAASTVNIACSFAVIAGRAEETATDTEVIRVNFGIR